VIKNNKMTAMDQKGPISLKHLLN